jgi:hypothetical protein
MMLISDKTGKIQLPAEPGLLEWLETHYPYSQYHYVTI